jgi:hypothetical protein
MSRKLSVGLVAVGYLLMMLPTPAPGQRRVAEETLIFKATRDGVFTVFGDHGHGSGFLIDDRGLVLTNAHVVHSSHKISVQLDDSTRVRANLLIEDESKDIAVLSISPDVVRSRPILKLADRPVEEIAFEGEKVLAIGSPLNQTRILTSGIVSKVEEGALISDVSINPGNSGGPLLNLDSEVIAINTFRDPSLGGPGVSGSVPITIAARLITKAKETQAESQPPSADLLPVTPRQAFPPYCLRWAGKRCYKADNYTILAGGFQISVITPPRRYFLETAEEQRLAGKRRKRESAAGVDRPDMYDPLGERLQEWRQYVGDYAPLVLFHVTPKIGTTYYGHHVYEFKGDLQDFELRREHDSVVEVFQSMDMMPVSVSVVGASMDDIAQQGVFAYLCDPFTDEFVGSNLVIIIRDLKKPGQTIEVPIPRPVLEQVWVDFEPYRDMMAARKIARVVN